ncbi:adenylosuccinate synthase [Niabella ginsenosidivorans]|uniref:Adenylosuccinate synthetase n=1 Tax=Niabella ginsenosidivorans TaxID=1176587 RepID=A0A1A9I285_9BACT|nr:adenylosuccinate synthase [Niabella ginsenosidivorans]ANH81643.1 adenylosuccinate synthase [Niabella ginsenosidivorans]
MIDVILGLQWGDEGKGKIVDFFAKDYDVVARFQGGPNAGHTLYRNGEKLVLRQIPSGIFNEGKINLIGNGVVLDPISLEQECEQLTKFEGDLKKNLYVSERTNLIIPTHRALDKASEQAKGKSKIGSTLKGISPAYMDKTGRNALRVGDILNPDFKNMYEALKEKHYVLLNTYGFDEDISADEQAFFKAIEFLKTLNIVNGEYFINKLLKEGKKVLAEGAQGSMLDVDFGTFPFVTSSNTISAGVCNGLGVAPQYIKEVIGITKAYCTRVGSGPFPSELENEDGQRLRDIGREYGAVTGRPRRCGWIDLVALNFACMINGVTQLVMTKADVLDHFEKLEVCTAYELDGTEIREIPLRLDLADYKARFKAFDGWHTDITGAQSYAELPEKMKAYIRFINQYLGVDVRYISNGPEREQLIKI